MRAELGEWVQRLRDEAGDTFPRKITAFHPEMGAHGKFGEPCPRCGSPIQRIVHGERESNYCATCQTGGRLLKDRALSRLLREDWPRTLEELEGMHQR
jgi:formamidopyrimidine-DNA glycosylase